MEHQNQNQNGAKKRKQKTQPTATLSIDIASGAVQAGEYLGWKVKSSSQPPVQYLTQHSHVKFRSTKRIKHATSIPNNALQGQATHPSKQPSTLSDATNRFTSCFSTFRPL